MTNYPLMSQAATFLLNWATTGADGLLHTNANAHETQWWDAAGSIYAQDKSKVDVQVVGGRVVLVVVEAGTTGSMQVRNPWSGKAAEAFDGSSGAVTVPPTSASTFALPTLVGHWYAIVPAGTASAPPKVVVTGTPATTAKHLGTAAIGL